MAPPQVPFGAAMRRAHFTSFAAGYTPLNHGSYGAHPASVRAAHLAARDEAEGAPDPFIALGFEGRLARQRALAASLLRAPSADDLVFAPNATTAIDTVLKNLRWRPGDVVLCYDAVYPAVALALAWLCEYHRGAVRVEVVGDVAFPLPDDALVDAMVGAARRINGNGSGSGGGGGSGDGNEKGGERVRLAIVDTIISMPGIRVPFERLVPALQAEGALVLVDGAHGAGQVDIDLAALRPDFLVTNLHKWLFVPRGCAALYVPARHQHLIRTTLPTSFGFQRLDPAVPDRPRRFVEIFDFTGTNDVTHWLCVEEALRFRNEVCGGEASIQEYSKAVARRGGAVAAEVLGTDVMDSPGSCMRDCNFANVRLPLDDPAATPSADAVTAWLKATGVRESGIYFQTIIHRGHWYWRLSGTVYVEEADFRKGAEVLKALCERIRKGEHAPKAEGSG